MRLSSLTLRGFRNYRDCTIKFARNSLILGHNDVGKTNLVYALRLLLDPTLSRSSLEPKDGDFFAYDETNELIVSVQLAEVVEDCLRSRLKGAVSDDDETFIQYRATRDPLSHKKAYQLSIGPSLEEMKEIDGRFYLGVLSLRFVEGKRDLARFIRAERKELLNDAKARRADNEIDTDAATLSKIEHHLAAIRASVADLNYVKTATDSLNRELDELSYRAATQRILFDTGTADPADFVDKLELVSQVGDNAVSIGGDGRTNQIQLALWTARNRGVENSPDPEEVSLYCIEEPEVHLHPHQQRRLARYLANSLKSQVILTTHSPQIAAEFHPASIIRLYSTNFTTFAAAGGATPVVEGAIVDFGFRMNVIPAESFFSSAVLLVEGPSEVLLYRALALQIGLDLDRQNISILSMNGVGVKPFINLLCTLQIPFVVRTDRDLSKLPNSDLHWFAGVDRGLTIAKALTGGELGPEFDAGLLPLLRGFENPPPLESLEAARATCEHLNTLGVFVSVQDLENDLYDEIPALLESYTGRIGREDVVRYMQKAKATFMFEFLQSEADKLGRMADGPIAAVLRKVVQLLLP